MIWPFVADVNLKPTSTAVGSLTFAVAGVALEPNRVSAEDGEVLYEVPGPGVSRLRLSSTARDSIVYVPGAGAAKV